MAEMSRCCVCKNYSFKTGVCSKYPNKIPKDIFAELRKCKFYEKEIIRYAKEDEDLPIAKGR